MRDFVQGPRSETTIAEANFGFRRDSYNRCFAPAPPHMHPSRAKASLDRQGSGLLLRVSRSECIHFATVHEKIRSLLENFRRELSTSS